MTRTKEGLSANGIVATSSMQCKLICATEGLNLLTRSTAVYSFASSSMFAMGYRFVDMFGDRYGLIEDAETRDKTGTPLTPESPEPEITPGASSSGGSCINSTPTKTSAEVERGQIAQLQDEEAYESRRLQLATIQVRQEKTKNSILQTAVCVQTRGKRTEQVSPENKRLPNGYKLTEGSAPALYLTQGETLKELQELQARVRPGRSTKKHK